MISFPSVLSTHPSILPLTYNFLFKYLLRKFYKPGTVQWNLNVRQGFYHLLGMLLDFHTHPTNHPDLSESLYSIWDPCFSSTKVKENGYVKNNDDSSPASFNCVGSSLDNP